MSDVVQLGQHPDADQLSAFMEQALPPHEREATLAHLAVCAECRRIVAISLPPLESTPQADVSPIWRAAGDASPGRVRDWFRGWKIAWLVAPALAGLVVIGIYIRGESGLRGDAAGPVGRAELKEAARAVSPPHAPVRQGPAADSKPLEALVRRPAPARDVGRVIARSAGSSDLRVSDLPVSDLPDNGRAIADLKLLAKPAMGAQAGGAVGNGSGVGPGKGADVAPQPEVQGAVQSGVQTSALDGAGYAPSPTVAATAAKAPLARVTGMDSIGLAATRAVSPLPSGLPIISLALHLHQRLALDTKNALFVSEDDGRHWMGVGAKWSGRAVAVAMAVPTLPRAGAGLLAFDAARRISAGTFSTAGTMASSEGAALPGALGGFVTDAAGALIAGAQITVTGSGGATQSVRTDASGHYLVVNLPPGGYRIEAQSPGFLLQRAQATVAASGQATVNLSLRVGAAAQTVTVDAAAIGGLEPVPSPAQNSVLSNDQATAQATNQVSARTSAARFTAAPAQAAKAKTPKPSTGALPLFVLTTDTGERWTSSDGQNWKRE